MRRFLEIVLVILLVTASTFFMIIALFFPARGVRLISKRLAQKFSDLARQI
jgi:hypothetical protein